MTSGNVVELRGLEPLAFIGQMGADLQFSLRFVTCGYAKFPGITGVMWTRSTRQTGEIMVKTLRRIAAAAVLPAVAAAVLAPPASADGNDTAFLAVLDQNGIDYPTSAYAINAGRQVCAAIDAGNTPMHEANVIYHGTDLSFTLAMAGTLVGDSIAAYCPWDKYLIPGGSSSQVA